MLINNSDAFSQKDSIQQISSQLENTLNWNAKDSIVLDMKNETDFFLYKEGHIDYGEIILDACYIRFNFESKTVFAKYCLDSNNQKIGKPVLSDDLLTSSDSLKI